MGWGLSHQHHRRREHAISFEQQNERESRSQRPRFLCSRAHTAAPNEIYSKRKLKATNRIFRQFNVTPVNTNARTHTHTVWAPHCTTRWRQTTDHRIDANSMQRIEPAILFEFRCFFSWIVAISPFFLLAISIVVRYVHIFAYIHSSKHHDTIFSTKKKTTCSHADIVNTKNAHEMHTHSLSKCAAQFTL